MDEFKQKLEETLNRLYKENQLSIDAYSELIEFADPNQSLQLQQTGINGSFFKCTCLRPQTNCFSGKCSYCNKTIQKDITTDDL